MLCGSSSIELYLSIVGKLLQLEQGEQKLLFLGARVFSLQIYGTDILRT